MPMNDDDFETPLHVPYISSEELEYQHGGERSKATESLIKREFGDLGALAVCEKRVSLGDRTLIDLDHPELDDADDLYTRPWRGIDSEQSQPKQSKVAAEFDQLLDQRESLTLDSVFRIREVDNGKGLRIAVQSPLLNSKTPVLRQLMAELEKHAAEDYEIDLNLCSEMSITGLGILLMVQKKLDTQSERIKVTNGNSQVMQLLKWAGMEQYFSLQ